MSRTVVFAYLAAALFAIALVLNIATIRVGPLTGGVFTTAGLLCLALHLAGVAAGARNREAAAGRRA